MVTQQAQQVLDRSFLLRISINNLGKLAGVSGGEISARLNGRKPLVGELAQRLLKLTDELLELQKVNPTPIDWAETDLVLAALKEYKEIKEVTRKIQEAFSLEE
jgi:hypothetical protein